MKSLLMHLIRFVVNIS